MNEKTIKATGDMEYAGVFIPKLLEYTNKKDGINIGHTKNHHTILFTLNNGEEFTTHVYETKTMIIMEWYIQ